MEGLITAFLLPARELRAMQTVKQRVQHYAAGKNPLLASVQQGTAGTLARHSSNPELIKAINPLAGEGSGQLLAQADGGCPAWQALLAPQERRLALAGAMRKPLSMSAGLLQCGA